ncbi:MAG TPA: ATP-binding protein [Yinghuangia sp.]|uniref:ATP-binding protein n=1 Tax=Yinghuangia sp. YIM S10712 TaxID=3436930 RepID=UPI002B9AD081|nr:ATP-binding protein [Yinghuangia sp.]
MTMATTQQPRPTEHPGYAETLPRRAATVQTARSLVRAAVTAWGMGHLAAAAELVMSELVTNAVLHASGPLLRVIVERPADDRVLIAVVDRAPDRMPQLRTPDLDDATGRGLLLVNDAAYQWGCDVLGPPLRPWGKRVWAEFDTH